MRILITAGPTREFLDPIRFLSNTSSGRMGFAIAEAALASGHDVVLVAGPVSLDPPPGAVYAPVTSAQEMYEAVMAHWHPCDGAIACAAVADLRARTASPEKIKKTGRPMSLELVPTVDILGALGRDKGNRWLCGFALETEDLLDRARAKLLAKNLDLIVANQAGAIGRRDSRIVVLDRDGQAVLDCLAPKPELARRLIALIDARFGPGAPPR